MPPPSVVQLALYGSPGAGKSTAGTLISNDCAARCIASHRIKLAEPLYRAQAVIYELARSQLLDPSAQDGELLAFLGAHMRRLNPTCLVDDFTERLDALTASLGDKPSAAVIVCDDMRSADWSTLKALGFTSVLIDAESEECISRRRDRGDLTLTPTSAWTEQGLDQIQPMHVIDNNGKLDSLSNQISALLDKLMP